MNNYYEQRWTPIHFEFDFSGETTEWAFANTIEDGECDTCGESIGQCWWIQNDTDACDWTPYWQIDEDGERNLCEYCYDQATAEHPTVGAA